MPKLRNRRQDVPRINRSPTSVFRLHRSGNKTILYMCLFQAIAALTIAGYIVQYHAWVLEDETSPMVINETSEETGEIKDGYSNTISAVVEKVKFSEGHVYALFRFDKYRNGREREIPKQLKTDAGDFEYFSQDKKYFAEDVPVWCGFKIDYDKGRFEEYGGRVVCIKDVQINPSLGLGKEGGEEVNNVLNQAVHEEYLKLQKGYFMYKADEPFEYKIPESLDIHKLVEGLLIEPALKEKNIYQVNKKYRVAIVTIRREYANFYHSTMNWYDIFLIMVIFQIDPKDVDIIWMDAHPKSNLDEVWETLYGKPIRAGSIVRPVTYEKMIWNGISARSQINAHKTTDLPYVNEFRHFVLDRYAVPDVHRIDCESIRVTVIWRRDHVAHPRNPKGFISRKIENEEELCKAIRDSDTSLVVNGVQLDEISMKQQLLLIAQTDILIGMHGAGLTHVLYLPSTSGVIELFPTYFSPANAHFRSLAKWRRIPYMDWVNTDKSMESKDHKTKLPANVVKEMVEKMKVILCEKKKGP